MIALQKQQLAPQTATILVTPSLAKEWLSQNTNNRPLNTPHVARLAKKMADGEWLFTHQGIAFDVLGRLVDGQHRLQAIVKAGATVPMLVTTGVDTHSFEHIDVDANKRSASDLLSIRRPSAKNTHRLTSLAAASMAGLQGSYNGGPRECSEFCDELYDDLAELLNIFAATPNLFTRAASLAVFFNAFRSNDRFPGPKGRHAKSDVLRHAQRYASQQWHGESDPMFVLCRRFQNEVVRRNQSGKNLVAGAIYGLTVSALRAALEGRALTRIEATSVDWDGAAAKGGAR
jgi:hypothetical protein